MTMLLDASESQLVLVDYQTRLMPVIFEGQAALALCDRTLSKMHFSAAEEGLGEWLRPATKPQQGGNARSLPKHLQKPQQAESERGLIVIAGCEAHVCLLQTALDLIDDEFDVWVVTDACSSRTERNRDAAFVARL